MRVAVVGLGSIGARHADNLRALGCQVAAVRRAPGPTELGSLDEAAAWGAEAIVVATPTSEHDAALRWAVEHGLHAYVEKPIAAEPDELVGVLDRAEANGVVVAVGYNLRFHPAVEAMREAVATGRIGRLVSVRAEVGQALPGWQPGTDYRHSYAARHDLGGGALLTLSHELDYVRWIAGEVARTIGVVTRASSLELDVDDVAEIVCIHAGGAVSSVHMDLVDRSYNRRARWVGELGTIAWEWGGDVRALPDGEVVWVDAGYDPAESYRAAMRDFLDAVESGRPPRCTGRDGLEVLRLCEEARR